MFSSINRYFSQAAKEGDAVRAALESDSNCLLVLQLILQRR